MVQTQNICPRPLISFLLVLRKFYVNTDIPRKVIDMDLFMQS